MTNIVAAGIKLDIGAGNVRHKKGYLTLDSNPDLSPNIVATVPPIPLPDEVCLAVQASHFLEHLPDEVLPDLFREVWRILQVGGEFEVICPYAFSHGAIQDPTHKSQWVIEKALYWTPHFSYLGYGYEDRFQLVWAEQTHDEIHFKLKKTATREKCHCMFGEG